MVILILAEASAVRQTFSRLRRVKFSLSVCGVLVFFGREMGYTISVIFLMHALSKLKIKI